MSKHSRTFSEAEDIQPIESQPMPEVVEDAVVESEPVVEEIKETKNRLREMKEVVVDRSAYNCTACKGDGLVELIPTVQTRCETCLGTGKV